MDLLTTHSLPISFRKKACFHTLITLRNGPCLLQEVTQSLSTAVVGDKIAVSGTSDKVYLSRMRTPAELRRIKRQVRSRVVEEVELRWSLVGVVNDTLT